jgi:hypothetical protein
MSGTGQAAIDRRRRGTGSIRERSPGHYELRAYNPVTGRQVTKTFHAPRREKGSGRRAAGAELAKLVAEVAEGKHDRSGQRASVGELLDDWLSQRKAVGCSPTTLHDYAASGRRIKGSASMLGTPDSLTRAFARLCSSLEAEARHAGRDQPFNFRFHDLRHFSATELIGAGVDIRTVAGRLGHAGPAITLRVYAHALEERDRAAAQLLSRRFSLSKGQKGVLGAGLPPA